MNVPKLMPTTSQIICLFVSHIEEELRASFLELGVPPLGGVICKNESLPPEGGTPNRSPAWRLFLVLRFEFDCHPRQHTRLSFDLRSNVAGAFRSHMLIEAFHVWIG